MTKLTPGRKGEWIPCGNKTRSRRVLFVCQRNKNLFSKKQLDEDKPADERSQVVAEKPPNNHGYRQEMFGQVDRENRI